jgi:hypothetical protein
MQVVMDTNFFGPVRTLLAALPLIPRSGARFASFVCVFQTCGCGGGGGGVKSTQVIEARAHAAGSTATHLGLSWAVCRIVERLLVM